MTSITIVGNLADNPTTRTVQGGKIVTNLIVLESRRVLVDDNWTDSDPNRFEVEAWDQLAANAATLAKGEPVVVVGKIITHKWKTDNNEPRSRQVVRASVIGFSLARHTVVATKVTAAE